MVGLLFYKLLYAPDLEKLIPQVSDSDSVIARFDARLHRFDGSLRLYRWSARLVTGRIGSMPGKQAFYVRGQPVAGTDFSLSEALTSRVVSILTPPNR